ncbi:Hypothetical protein GLP15_1016 [Giardia lamblia P15]|uniref:Uncharacterized protein n=1 Tax=Giardia intestinalis (strain P15) TaxID=658858 RepID=E1F318_GIAIA|nr:Hypothetical protein GLP15_1016 [Giardia lamblia P15]
MPHMILPSLSSCKTLTKTEDMRNMIRDIEDALSAYPQDYSELSLGVQESLCILITQLLDENFRAAHLPILNLIINTVQSGPVTLHLEKVLAKAFVEPITIQQKYTSDAKTTLLVNTLFRLVDAGIKQKAFGMIATGSALCFLLSIYNASSVRNVPLCLRIEAEQRIVRLLQMDLPENIKQKVIKPLLDDCVLCLLSTTSLMKMLREPVENIDSILWLTALTLEQAIKYKFDIDAALVTALKVRIHNLTSTNFSEYSRPEFQNADDIFTQLTELSSAELSLSHCSLQCLFPFVLSSISMNPVKPLTPSSVTLFLLTHVYSFNMLLSIAVSLFKYHQSSDVLLIALLTLREADSFGYYSTNSIPEKTFLPLLQARCLVTYTCMTITSHIFPLYETDLDSSPHSNLALLLDALITAQYNMLLTNDTLSLSTAMDSVEAEFGISFESSESIDSTVQGFSLFKALYSLYPTKESKNTRKQTNVSMLYVCGFSLISWNCTIKKLTTNEMFINALTPSTILVTTLSLYRLLSHDCCLPIVVEDSANRYSHSKILDFLYEFVKSILRASENKADPNLEELVRAVSALPCFLCLLYLETARKDTYRVSFANIQTLLHCSCVTQVTQQTKDADCTIPPLITNSESNLAFSLFSHVICTSSSYSTTVSKMLSYADFLIDLHRLFLPHVDRLVKSSTGTQCVSTLLASLVEILHFWHIADVQAPSPAKTLYNILYAYSDDSINATTMELYDSLNGVVLLGQEVLNKLNSNSLDCNSTLFLIIDERKRKSFQKSASSVEEFTSICIQTQAHFLFRIPHDLNWRQRLLESTTMARVCEAFNAQFYDGLVEISEKDLSLSFGYGLLLGALTLRSLDDFDISSEIKERLIDSLTDQSLFGCDDLLLLFPSSFRKLHSLLGLLASTETFLCTLSQLCLALTDDYKLSMAIIPNSTPDSDSKFANESKILLRLTLLSQIVMYIPLLCQDKLPSQTVIKIHQNCVGLLTLILNNYYALDRTSSFADKFLHAYFLILHRLFDFLDSKLVDAIEYLQVYENILTYSVVQSDDRFKEIWCIGLLRVVRLCSTPISAMRIKIVELLCKIVGNYLSVCNPTDTLVLTRDVLFKSMSILITCSPTTSRKANSSTAATIVSCHQIFFTSCMNVVSSAAYPLKIQVIRAFISLMHSLSVTTGLSMVDDSIRLFCMGMKPDSVRLMPSDDGIIKTTDLSFEELFSRVMQYPLMESFFPEVFQKSLEHSPWLSLLSDLKDEDTTLSLTALFEDVLSLLVIDGKASCQSSAVLLDLCSVVFSLLPHLMESIEIATRILLNAITLINIVISAEDGAEQSRPEIEKALSEIPVRLAKELVCKCNTQQQDSYLKTEVCLSTLFSYTLSNEAVFTSIFTCLYELLKQSSDQEDLCKLLSAQLSNAFISSCSVGTFGPKTLSLCLSIILTLYISLLLTEAGNLAESLNIAAVSYAVLKLEAYPQLHLILTIAIYNNYLMFKDVIDDDVLYLIISRFLPCSNRYSADSSSNNGTQLVSVVSSFDLFVYGNIDSELIFVISSFPQSKREKAALALEKLTVLYSYNKPNQELLVTIDSTSLHQLLFNTALFTLSLYMESVSTLKKCISLIRNVLAHVEYNYLHFHAIPPSERLYKHVSTLLQYIIEHTFPLSVASSILSHESMPLVYYKGYHDSAFTITPVRPQLFALQTAFFHFFKVCRYLPLTRQIELIYLESLSAEMKVK